MNKLLNDNKYKYLRLIKLQEKQRLYFAQKHLSGNNKDKILKLKDLHKRERCFIVGSSPTLNLLDLTKLNNEYVFTVNWGFKLKTQGLRHSNYHIMSDIKTFTDDNVMLQIPYDFSDTFLIYAPIDFNETNRDVVYFDYINTREDINHIVFQKDLTKPLIAYDTAIVHAMHFAFYMGFHNVYMIGVDLDFNNIAGHAYKETAGEHIRQQQDSVPSVQIMLEGIRVADKNFNQRGGRIYNASPSGIVDCVQRIPYEELF